MADEKRIIREIKRRYGNVIDLRESPAAIIDIIRRFRFELDDDGGLPPGGTPSPPGPTSFQASVTIEDLMKEVLKLSRQIAQLRKQLAPPGTGRR